MKESSLARALPIVLLLLCLLSCSEKVRVVQMAEFGVVPGAEGLTEKVENVISNLRATTGKDSLVLKFAPGRYDFHPSEKTIRECFISNHGRFSGSIGIDLDSFSRLTLDGDGADMVFHGIMLPISLQHSSNCTIRNLSIDVSEPLADISAIVRDPQSGYLKTEILHDHPDIEPFFAMVIDRQTRHLVYNTGDVSLPYNEPEGSVMIMRSGVRPCPGIFLNDNTNTCLEDVSIFGAHGMGILAQMCHNVTLSGCAVRPRDENHFMSALCDATHFSQCSGSIISCGGFYEAMGDDAINVHGIGLSIARQLDERTVVAEFRHHETFGLDWGKAGDEVQFLSKRTSLPAGFGTISSISQRSITQLEIRFEEPLPEAVGEEAICLENLTRTAEVVFCNNHIGNNRARGSLFTTPRKVVVADNTFDHVAGTAILISGDCNFWYETGACHDVLITRNRFINCLGSRYGGCNAIISIAPEIIDLEAQKDEFYHSGISIEGNEFCDFGSPLVYAKSVKGLKIKDNTVISNTEYEPIFTDAQAITLVHAEGCEIVSASAWTSSLVIE